MNSEFWRGRKVLLTGHTGFKGAWTSLWLQELGAEVTGYALAPAEGSLFQLARLGRGMHSVIGDIRDPVALRQIVDACRPEIVIHMAAQALVRESYSSPADTFAVNVMGTVNLLEAVRGAATVRAVVNVTTDKCYENREWVWPYRENEPLGGRDPYSSSKACSELVTSAYRASFFAAGSAAIATARAGNVIGGGDIAPDRLVPDILAAVAKSQPAVIRRPLAVRPWQHVLEPLRGYLLLAERLHDAGAAFAEAWNFGPLQEDAQKVEWVARRLATLWGQGASIRVEEDPQAPHEATSLKLDVSKAAARLGWRPALPLPDALQWVVDWARRTGAGDSAREVCLEQVRAYQARVRQDASTV